MRLHWNRLAVVLLLIAGSTLLFGQAANNVLQPPAGAKVAVIIWEDLECPQCALMDPYVQQAGEKYSIPIVRYNYPLQQHTWALDAAVMAEYFESKSPKLGVDFREYIFQNQPKITKFNLQRVADEFAQKHDTPLPFLLDPQGKFHAIIQHDKALGEQVGLSYTPTIYVVSKSSHVEVKDPGQLFSTIEQMLASSGG